ncbi:GNAT family N-acetyltransferase [Sphingomonas sp. MMS12-HWE2-04]|uniref:GNAT family N-acetyltransferase n=1 Tax=Sphingomonas sp. MMS12-HWE2-04 TaxID=3234199 RepID=UPI00384F2573
MTISIRPVVPEDAAVIADIYAHHVLHGTATYEMVPPSAAAMRAKIEHIAAKGWPFLVAHRGEKVLGYCYATQFRDRPAYAFACEDSIYVSADQARLGIGRALLGALLAAATAKGFRQMVAVIGGGEPASVALHAALGFEHAGRLSAMGWKAGRWLDSVYMQIALGEGSSTDPASH